MAQESPQEENKLFIDPGLPKPNPTIPFWQDPPHALANVSSTTLPATADIAIIGSGMTGCSVAKRLLEAGSPKLKIVVLEARGLASGATSRNGGHIVSPSLGDFENLVKCYGARMAAEIAEFTLGNCEETFGMVEGLGDGGVLGARAELRRVKTVLIMKDGVNVEAMRKRLGLWNEHMPESRRDMFKLSEDRETIEEYGLADAAAVAVGDAGAVWPYRLWAGLWENLHTRFPERLSIETHTAVLSVQRSASTYDSSDQRYKVTTSRGIVHASKVVYCTNGFTAHLLPQLRGKIFPMRGTMSTQNLGEAFPNHGQSRSWSFSSAQRYDAETGTKNAGAYYLTQNGKTGDMFLGGEHDRTETLLCSDDTVTNLVSARKIVEVLPQVFKDAKAPTEVKRIWSGIMGFTLDGLPIVGRLPEEVTGRADGDEWIAAGFNGYGTGYCYRCGMAVADMMMGKSVDWVPKALLVTKERLAGSLTSSPFYDGWLQ